MFMFKLLFVDVDQRCVGGREDSQVAKLAKVIISVLPGASQLA